MRPKDAADVAAEQIDNYAAERGVASWGADELADVAGIIRSVLIAERLACAKVCHDEAEAQRRCVLSLREKAIKEKDRDEDWRPSFDAECIAASHRDTAHELELRIRARGNGT